jgi:hypothetical protein
MKRTMTYGDVDGFVTMLLVACEDTGINETLELLLSQPDDRRRDIVLELLDRLRMAAAPQFLCEAIACLLDDKVAEKAYEVIHNCRRSGRLPS